MIFSKFLRNQITFKILIRYLFQTKGTSFDNENGNFD